jgi:YegS/Rv2252/BmrU family lipid kinase
MQALLAYNPVAGRVPVRPFVYRAARALRESGWQVRIAATQSGSHALDLARQAAADGLEAVFAVGGDGTMGQMATGLVGSQTALGVLPAGTSNVLGLDLGLQAFGWSRWWALEENIHTLVNSPIYNVDLGMCGDRPFLLWAGLGLDALTIQATEPRPRINKYISVPHYAAITIWNASRWAGIDLSICADGSQVDGHYLLAVVNNIRSYLGGMARLSPDARLDDGQMDLWLFSGSNLADALRHAFGMMSGQHLSARDVLRIPFHDLNIKSQEPFSLQLDGEPGANIHEVNFSILPRSLRMMIPVVSLDLLIQANSGYSVLQKSP